MSWTVRVKKKAMKRAREMPQVARANLQSLMRSIEESGPVRGDWPHYSKLGPNKHHCHLKEGQPTYVAVWEEIGEQINLVEVTYAGTHEKAPY